MVSITELREIFDIAFALWPCFILAATGLVTNVMCIVVFARQGFHESATISLAAIAVMEFVKCLVGFAHRLNGIVDFVDTILSVNWLRATYLLNSNAQLMAGTLVNVYTMYVTFERCLCVCLPFKVKLLITVKVTYLSLLALTLVVVSMFMPNIFLFEVAWEFDPYYNQTMAQYAMMGVYEDIQPVMNFTNAVSIFWSAVPFIAIMSCTSILIIRLQQMGKFRDMHSSNNDYKEPPKTVPKMSSAPANQPSHSSKGTIEPAAHFVGASASLLKTTSCKGDCPQGSNETDSKVTEDVNEPFKNQSKASELQNDKPAGNEAASSHLGKPSVDAAISTYKTHKKHHLSSRDAQLVRMLLLVVLMFVINSVPRLVIAMARYIEPEFNTLRKYHDHFLICVDVYLALDFINSSTNLFIYLAMSSHFRETFTAVFGIAPRK